MPDIKTVPICRKVFEMNSERQFQRVAAWAAILSMPLAFASLVASLAAVDFNFEAVSDPAAALPLVAEHGLLWQWSFVFDLFGYYLLLVPLALFLWNWLKPRSPSLISLFTLSGLGYLLFGAMGAAIFAIVLPTVAEAYAQATGGIAESHRAVFEALNVAVQIGVWGLLGGILSAVWWIGIGAFLRRERRVLGWVTVVLGAFVVLGWIGMVAGIEAVFTVGLMVYLILAPIWALWLGIDLLRTPAI